MTYSDTLLRLTTIGLIAALTTLSAFASDGIAAYERGDYKGARTALEQELKADADNAQLHYHLGRTLMELQDSKAAAKTLERAVELAPNDADIHVARGEANGTIASNVNILRAGRYAKVVRQSFERALEIDPQHIDALDGMIVYKLRAPKLLGGSKAEALELSARLIEVAPIRGRVVRANTLRAMERNDEATSMLNELATEFKDDPRAHLELGFMQQNDKNYAEAATYFRAASIATSDTDEKRYARDMARYQLGRTAVFSGSNAPEGIEALRQFLASDERDLRLPGADWASFRLAELLGKNGETDEAQALLKSALAMTQDKDLKRRLKAEIN
ncbi:MAG: tetratricopeptide repeat protein [Gammaproteobacteria bacterium]